MAAAPSSSYGFSSATLGSSSTGTTSMMYGSYVDCSATSNTSSNRDYSSQGSSLNYTGRFEFPQASDHDDYEM
jgi:hypothetical protein